MATPPPPPPPAATITTTTTAITTLLPTLAALALSLVLPLLYIYTASVAQTRLPHLRRRRVCLLIAHPDDEAMFFAPSVLALTRPGAGNHVKILCLSTGDADGLGETRRRELKRSGVLLGLRGEEDVMVIDSPDFPDSMTRTWDAAKISDLLCRTLAPHLLSPSSSSSSTQEEEAPAPEPAAVAIDALVTFDAAGVSSHPNHVSLYHGARAFARAASRPAGRAPPLDLYTLTSVPVWRKYAAFLDAPATLLLAFALAFGGAGRSDRGSPGVLVSMSGLCGGGSSNSRFRESYGAARRAMTEAHKSQMVWFRWGWIALSRYMYINDLRLERVKA